MLHLCSAFNNFKLFLQEEKQKQQQGEGSKKEKESLIEEKSL